MPKTKMLMFDVVGPYEVPTRKGKGGVKIVDHKTKNARRSFWDKADCAEDRGCYIFCIRAGKGVTPAYVGKAAVTFKGEVFAPAKLRQYNEKLADIKAGTPVLFFLVHPSRKVKTWAIAELENFLIEALFARYPNLLNIVGTKQAGWGIAGVLKAEPGAPPKPAQAVRHMLGLQSHVKAAAKRPQVGERADPIL
jgi:hypothetical protein